MPERPRPSLDFDALLGSLDPSSIDEQKSRSRTDSLKKPETGPAGKFDAAEFLSEFLAQGEVAVQAVYEPEPEPEPEPVATLVSEEHISVGGLAASTQARTGRTQQPKVRTKPTRGGGTTRREKKGTLSPEEDLVRVYLRDIGKYPLLTKEQEVDLAQKIEVGKAASVRLENLEVVISTPERRMLGRQIREAERAQMTFVNCNLRLVVSIAKKYQASGLPLLDLIQEGNVGMMHAVEKFDWRKGFKFSTYATWWIRQAITRGIANTGRTIRLPVHAGETLTRVQKARARLTKDNVEPTIYEIAADLEMETDKVLEALLWARDPLSLSEPLNSDPRSDTLGDLVPDSSSVDGYDEVDKSDLPDKIEEAFKCLDEREREILRRRFALSGGEPKTLEEVGEYFNLTRERIRQIESRAMSKLRHPSNGGALEAFRDLAQT